MTVYGSWKFFSTLTIPLCVKLTSLLTDEEREGSPPIPTSPALSSPPPSSLPSPHSFTSLPCRPVPRAGLGIEKTLTVQPKGSSPSILGPKRELGGVVLRTVGAGLGTEWSNIYPLPCEEGWTNPHLLVEVLNIGRSVTNLTCSCTPAAWRIERGDSFLVQCPGYGQDQQALGS